MQYKISHHLRFLRPEFSRSLALPLFNGGIRAGFPSPAADFEEEQLNLSDLIPNPETTFFAWAEGTSMTGLGVLDGDLLVIDKAAEPCMGDIVVAVLDAEFTVKQLGELEGKPYLLPANPDFPPIPVPPGGLQIWGVVIRVIHNPRPRARRRKI